MNGIFKITAAIIDSKTLIPKPFKTVVRTSNDKAGRSLSIEYGDKMIMIPMDEIWKNFK